MEKIKIAVVDDHGLYRKGLINLIHSLNEAFEVVWQAANGQEFLKILSTGAQPDLVIMDLDMPVMNGFETAAIVQKEHPHLYVLVISMLDDEISLIKMLRLGVLGFMSKDVEPDELKKAIESVSQGAFHHNEALTSRLVHALRQNEPQNSHLVDLQAHELEFLKLSCSELTYKEIADQMFKSPKTIDGYRASLFEKLGAKSRVGLVMYAIKNQLVTL